MMKTKICIERSRMNSDETIALVASLKDCAKHRNIQEGSRLHASVSSRGLVEKNVYIGVTLISMYSKCGALSKARQVLYEITSRNVVHWNALISGYAEHGLCKEALDCLSLVKSEGLAPNAITFSCVLKACGNSKALDQGMQIHKQITNNVLLTNDVVLGNALVDMYVKCSALKRALDVFENLLVRDTVSWNTLIAGFAQWGHGEEALKCFNEMKKQGFCSDHITYISILKVCASTRDLDKGKQMHSDIVIKGLLGRDVALGNALVDMYGKCGDVENAQEVFDDLPSRDIISWNVLIGAYMQTEQGRKVLETVNKMQNDGIYPDHITLSCIIKVCGAMRALDEGRKLHDEIITKGLLRTEEDVVLGTALVDMYAKCGVMRIAKQVFDEVPFRNIVSWNALIGGYAQQGDGWEALKSFKQMQSEGLSPDVITFSCALKACGAFEDAEKGNQIHSQIVSTTFLENDVIIGNALVDMYAKCGLLTKAKQVFDELPSHNAASWNALITGYVQHDYANKALECFELLQNEGLEPDTITFVCILKACGIAGVIDKGVQVHELVCSKELLQRDSVLGTAMVDMYAKCGELAKAEKLFDELPLRGIVSWNALIAGYAQQGQVERVLSSFKQMQKEDICPDAITFLCVLNACSHCGLVREGESYFFNMNKVYKIEPDLDHHTCMVDLYGRAGRFDKAMVVIKSMPSSEYPPVWGALLGACRKWGNVKLGRYAFDEAVKVNINNPASYAIMINIYAAAGMYDEAHKIEAMRSKICCLEETRE